MAEPPKQIKPASLNDYLEVMSKAVFHSGLNWTVIETKWPGLREAFQGFDVRKVADFDVPDWRPTRGSFAAGGRSKLSSTTPGA